MSDHWYTQSGEPAYEVPAKNGSMRPTTLRDARKLGLVPSVTTVLSVIDKPQLVNWKVRQGIMAALTLPPIDGESEHDWLKRIEADSQEQAKEAAAEGSRIHDAIERSFKGLVVDETYKPHVQAVHAELARLFPGVSDWEAEESFSAQEGFGGKVDLHSPSTGIVVDFKGKDGDFTDGKRLAYDQHWQLAAYQCGLILSTAPCANIFVSRTHPGKVSSHVWSEHDLAEGWRVFYSALQLWKSLKGFDPSFGLARAA